MRRQYQECLRRFGLSMVWTMVRWLENARGRIATTRVAAELGIRLVFRHSRQRTLRIDQAPPKPMIAATNVTRIPISSLRLKRSARDCSRPLLRFPRSGS